MTSTGENIKTCRADDSAAPWVYECFDASGRPIEGSWDGWYLTEAEAIAAATAWLEERQHNREHAADEDAMRAADANLFATAAEVCRELQGMTYGRPSLDERETELAYLAERLASALDATGKPW